jgi:hypothetical protein
LKKKFGKCKSFLAWLHSRQTKQKTQKD